MNRPPYPPLPSDSIHPKMAPHPHFPVMHPVPMIPVYPGYAPWFMPQFGLPGAVDPLDAQNGYYASGHTARLARYLITFLHHCDITKCMMQQLNLCLI